MVRNIDLLLGRLSTSSDAGVLVAALAAVPVDAWDDVIGKFIIDLTDAERKELS